MAPLGWIAAGALYFAGGTCHEEKMSTRSSGYALFFSSVGHSFSHILMLLYPTVVLALERSFGLGYDDLIVLATPGFILFGIAALPAGWLGDRWSAERMMVLYFLGSGLSAMLTGLAQGPMGLLVGLTFIGLFASIYHPVGIAWLVRNAEKRGRAMAWNGIFGSIGVGSASLLAGVLTDFISWRAAFLIPGAICTAIGIALAVLVGKGSVVADTEDRTPDVAVNQRDMIRVFVVLSITMLGTGLVGQIVMVAMPKIFENRLGDLLGGGTLGVGFLVSAVYIATAIAQIPGGWCADRFPLKTVYLLAWAAQMPLYILAAPLLGLPLLATVVLVAVVNVFATPVENVLLARYTPARWRATAYGAKFVLALGVSALGVPLIGFVYAQTGGFYWLFIILAATAAGVAVAAAFLPGTPRAASLRGTLAQQPAE